MTKTEIRNFRPVYPSPAALITCVDPDGRANVITLAEVFNISIAKPVIVGLAIRKATYSHGLISESGEFVINQPTAEIVRQVDQCGCVSGRDCADKLAAFGLTALPASIVSPPLIAECPVNIECKLLSVQEAGDHDLFLGEVLAVHADADKVNADGKLQIDKLDPLAYMAGEYWTMGKQIATHGYSQGDS